jgi:hypothetical protein
MRYTPLERQGDEKAVTDHHDGSTPSSASAQPVSGSPASLFALLWDTLAELLGPATTATLLRRSVKYSLARNPTLQSVAFSRESFEYRYDLPASWGEPSAEALEALRALLRELWRVLIPLTGQVVVRRLEELDEFKRCGLIPFKESE